MSHLKGKPECRDLMAELTAPAPEQNGGQRNMQSRAAGAQ